MPQISTPFRNTRTSKIMFFLSLLVPVFWGMGKFMDIYHVAIVGALFEILWLPMLAMIFLLPLLALIYWVKEKFNINSLHLYSILIVTATVLLMVFLQ